MAELITLPRAVAQRALASLRGYRREIGCEQPCDAERALEAALAYREDIAQAAFEHWLVEKLLTVTAAQMAHAEAVEPMARPISHVGTYYGKKNPALERPIIKPEIKGHNVEPPPEAQTEAEKIAYCAGWWAAMEQKRQQPDQGGKTGWPPGLLQDDCRGLSKWLASQPDARRRVREAVAALEQPERATITVQEAWEAAGGNPGIKATKEELITALQLLDKVCDEAPQAEPEQDNFPEEKLQAVAEYFGDKYHVWYGIGARDVEEVLRQSVRRGLVTLNFDTGEQQEQDTDCHAQGVCQRSGYGIGQPEQEPVAYLYHDAQSAHDANPMLHSTLLVMATERRPEYQNETPLYTHPPRREWRSLSEEEINECWASDDPVLTLSEAVTRAIEAALKEKNHD